MTSTSGSPRLVHGSRSYSLADGPMRIGSGPEAEIRLEGETVEPLHAAVTRRGADWILQDLSEQGTVRVGGVPARSSRLEPGDRVRFGQPVLELRAGESGWRLEGKALRLPLRAGENRVGRTDEAHLTIDDPSVSREHALIVILPSGQIWVRDLGSSNGTWVNDRRLGEQTLAEGDELEIGGEKLTFLVATEPQAPGAPAENAGSAYEATQLLSLDSEAEMQLVVDGEARPLESGRTVVGRVPECDVSFPDDPSVSREHAALLVAHGHVTIEDLGSSNGTYVNDERIHDPTVIRHGDRIRIGSHDLELCAPEVVDPYQATMLVSTVGAGKAPAPSSPGRESSDRPPPPPDMPSEERLARETLDLEPSAGEDEIRRKYRELYSDFQIRLENAPTPELKAKFEKKLAELRAAVETLAPGVLAPPGDELLPASEPVDRTSAWVSTPPAESQGASEAATSPPPVEAGRRVSSPAPSPGPEAAPPAERRKIPTSTILIAILSLLLVAATAVLAYLYREAAAVESGLRAELAERQEVVAGLQSQIPTLEEQLEELQESKARLLENAELKICNLSSREMTIRWLNASYVDPTGRFETFDTAWDQLGWDKWNIAPDQTWKTQVVRGTQVVWDGSAVFFSVLMLYRGEEVFRAGATPTLGGDCYQFDLD